MILIKTFLDDELYSVWADFGAVSFCWRQNGNQPTRVKPFSDGPLFIHNATPL